ELYVAHVNFLLFRPLVFLELEGHVQWRAVGLAFALRLKRGQLWLADFVMTEIERSFLIIALDRENFLEHGLQAVVFAFVKRHVFLQEIDVRIELNFNEIWRLNAFLNTAEMNTLCPF